MTRSISASQCAQPSMLPMTPGARHSLDQNLGFRPSLLSHYAAAAFIASLSFSGLGSADNIHLQQGSGSVQHPGLPLQYHISQFCSGLSHSPEGLVRNDPSTIFPHLAGVFLPCQQSSPPVSGSSSCFLLAIGSPFPWFRLTPGVE